MSSSPIVLTWGAGDDAASARSVLRHGWSSGEERDQDFARVQGQQGRSAARATIRASWPGRPPSTGVLTKSITPTPPVPWVGNVWSFTTAEFLVIDDFESYDGGSNQIWYSWHDGLGYGAPGTPPYLPATARVRPWATKTLRRLPRRTIVHRRQAVHAASYDNNKQGSRSIPSRV